MKTSKFLAICFVAISSVACSPTKFMEKSSNIFLKGVELTLKGTDWIFMKASGKINPDKLEGEWELIGTYQGTFDDFVKAQKEGEKLKNVYKSCKNEQAIIVKFDTKNGIIQNKCGNEVYTTRNYKYQFQEDINTKKYENFIFTGLDDYFTVMSISNKGN